MPVGHLGPDEVVETTRDADVRDVVQKLEGENVGAVVVTDGDEPVGVVTDRDVALAVTDFDDVGSAPIEDIMTENPTTVEESDEAMEVSQVIAEEDVRRIPVVDETGTVTGIVTLDDLVAAIGEQLDNVAGTIETQSPGYSP